MIFPANIPVFGDPKWRGDCPPEHVELASFFSKLRRTHPDTYAILAFHPRNEGMKTQGQFSSIAQHKAEGLTTGAADIIIPARISFVCELKRVDCSKSKWQKGQVEYLEMTASLGGYACVALGAVAAWEAFQSWVSSST